MNTLAVFGGSVLLLLAACTAPAPRPPAAVRPDAESSPVTAADAVPVSASADFASDFQRQRLIGDLLYDALRALQQDRLLTPIDDNAHGRYQRVLAYDPANQQALEGLQNIVLRYLELASDASRQGRFDDALDFLERARFVDEDSPAIAEAWIALQAEINSGDKVLRIEPQDLHARSSRAQQQLADIARQARDMDAFFLITAPTDEQARWMFSVMREAVEGYRLRGNIEIGSYAIVRLRKPRDANS